MGRKCNKNLIGVNMKYLVLAIPLIFGFVLDLFFGDPYNLPHPVRLIGNFTSILEKFFRNKMPKNLRLGGSILSIIVLFFSTAVPALILFFSYLINVWLGVIIESVFIYYLLAARCLYDESMKVCRAVEADNIPAARQAVSMIVGRDTDKLDKNGILRAAVETVAENTSDGETSPLFYIAFGGATAGFFYKAANTMDSMLGYKNEKYIDFGRFAAKFDDALNFITSRISAVMMIAAALILRYDFKNAYKIWRRDRNSQESPNAAQTEAAAAGALGLQLLGDAYYFGKLHHKKTIGDSTRKIETEDIRRVNRLMFATSGMMLLFAVAVRLLLAYLIF